MAGKDQNAYLLINGDLRKKIPCLFNPTELSLTLTNRWGSGADGDTDKSEAVPGKGVQTLNFQGSQNGTLDLTLFFDTTAEGVEVTKYTSQIVALMDIDPKIAGTNAKRRVGRPPTVQFGWGTMTSFPSVIESLTLKFTYFSSKGVPLRATMQLSLKQYSAARSYGPQNPTSGTPEPHRLHRVQPGETLDRISAQHFGDSTRWRVIAEANAIEDPLSLRPGSQLTIPKLDT
ncbi:MAG: Peptidoglycan-binding LysM [Frankiales bacterium]|nr:Peptidoglycan-binding LysM [Frankiales bacterium]